MIERVRKIKKKEGNRFNGYGKNDCCKKSTKWWLTVATGGALAVGLLGGYGLATAIHGTNNQQSAIQQPATMPGAPEQGQNGQDAGNGMPPQVGQNGQNGGPDNGMPPQDGGSGQSGQDQGMPPQDGQQSDNDKSKNSSAQQNDNGKKNKKKSSTNINEQSDKNNNKSTKENKTSQS